MIEAGVRGSIMGLTRMKMLCDILGNVENNLKFIHIAGTNGKGSTAAFISSILSTKGYKVGMYTSPALTGMKDHYRINGELISDEDYAKMVSILSEANASLKDRCGEEATQFELETALSFLYFSNNNCDVVVMETGLGGLEDATNVVSNKLLCVFTSISFDHMAYLGNTLSEIATVKAGIITEPCEVVAFNSADEVIDVITRKCEDAGANLTVVNSCDDDYFIDNGIALSLKGAYQRDNACVAITVARQLCKLGFDITENDIKLGLANAKWEYRYERICESPKVYVDGAHNEDAARRLLESVKEDFADYRIILVIGMFKDKEYEKVIGMLAPKATVIYTLTTPNNARSLDKEIIKSVASRYCENVFSCDDVKEAAFRAMSSCIGYDNSVVIAFGSLSYLSLFKSAVLDND